jgi:GNAT superfamily N-acetyltransferase
MSNAPLTRRAAQSEEEPGWTPPRDPEAELRVAPTLPRAQEADLGPAQLAGGAILREARPGDEPAIMALIKELAAFEHEPYAVRGDTSMLARTLFGRNPAVYAHVVEVDGRLAAAAVWFINYSTWTGRHGIYLEDIIVHEPDRGHGYGRALIEELARIAQSRGYGRMEWAALNWNRKAIDFYEGRGAQAMTDWTSFRLEEAAIARLARSAERRRG